MKNILTIAVVLLSIIPYHNGDLNHDGRVSITDLVIMRQMVEGLTKPSPFADMNHDGKVDNSDLRILRYKLATKGN